VLIEGSVFTILYAALAYACWRQNRWGYLGAGIVPLVVLAAQWNTPAGIMSVLQSPGGSTPFVLFLPFFVTSATAVLYGLYGAYSARSPQPYSRQISRSGIVAFIALGAIVGGLVVGAFAATAESTLLASSGGSGDIIIVLGSNSPSSNTSYSPPTFTAKVGQTVTWVNRDSAAHTVTSTTPAFDSGNMVAGATFSYKFSQPGTYQYVCTYHSWMKGTVVVTAG